MKTVQLANLVFMVSVFNVAYTPVSHFTQFSISTIIFTRMLFPVSLFS